MMKLVRRILAAVALAGLIAASLRVRGKGGTPPQHGGWRQLDPAAEAGGTPDAAGGGDPSAS